MRSPHSGEAAVSSCTAMPSVNQRGTRELVMVSVKTWLISCHSVESQWKLPGGRPEGLSMAMSVSEGHAERAQAGHAQRAHGEILVIGIGLHLDGAVQLELVFLLVSRDRAAHLGFEIGTQ